MVVVVRIVVGRRIVAVVAEMVVTHILLYISLVVA